MTSNHHAPYDLGYTRTTMVIKQREATQRCEANPEKSSQFRLQAATRLHEVGIASNRGSACRGEYVPGPCAAVNTFPGLVHTARHTMGVGNTRSQ